MLNFIKKQAQLTFPPQKERHGGWSDGHFPQTGSSAFFKISRLPRNNRTRHQRQLRIYLHL